MKKYVNPYSISIIALIISIMSYLDLGFNENLSVAMIGDDSQLNPIAFEQFTQDISGSKIQGGKFQSIDKNYSIDLENNINKVLSGGIERILYGKLPDGTFGMIINDTNGNEIGRLNENGLTIQQGKINIENESFKTIIDNQGLTSNSWNNNIYLGSPWFNMNTTTYNDVPNSIKQFSLKRSSLVYISFYGTINIAPTSGQPDSDGGYLALNIDGIRQLPVGKYLAKLSSSDYISTVSVSVSNIFTLSAGEHTIKLQFKSHRASGVVVEDVMLTYVVLGS